MKYYIIAGEASGDLHASNLMKALKKRDKNAEFRCWGGDLMAQQGGEIVRHYRDLAFMGFIEVLANLRTILSNIRFCKRDMVDFQPDAVILVDYPGFNLRMAEYAKRQGLTVFYYISPQVWAWKKSRVKKIKRFVDRMFVILPFEKDFYGRYDYDVDFVGHPLFDMIENLPPNDPELFRKQNGLTGKPIIALLPGSRKQEIKKMLALMLTVVPHFPDYQFVIAGAPSIDEDFYAGILNKQEAKLLQSKTHELLQNSYAALVTSGTATLETALLNIPEVVCYKGSLVSYLIARLVVDQSVIRFISLVNLIMNREVVKELIQDDLNAENLVMDLNQILVDGSRRQQVLNDYTELKNLLGGGGASAQTANHIINLLNV